MVSGALPTYEFPELNRILFFTESRTDRNYMIWRLNKSGINQYDIAKAVGCHQSSVSYHLLKMQSLGDDTDVEEYFQMSFEINDILRYDLRQHADKYISNIMATLWKNGIRTRKKLKHTSFARFKALLETNGMKRAGRVGQLALEEYRYRLRIGESTYDLYSKIAKGESKNGKH